MLRIFTYLSFLVIVTAFMSCAKVSTASSDSSDAAKSFEASNDRGTVYLYRTGRVVGAAGQLTVRVNGVEAGGTGPSTFFKWDLKPGTYTFNSSTGEASATVQVDVKAGEVYYIRQDARLGLNDGRVTMKEVGDSKGKSEVSKCKLLVSAYVPE